MALLTDRDEIRRLLHRDPGWSVYALGDLGPAMYPSTTWHRSGEQLALVLRSYSVPILWASGALEELVAEVSGEPRYSVQIRPAALRALSQIYRTDSLKRMWRMTVNAADFQPAVGSVARLGSADVPSLERLYADGQPAGESPEFFFGEMVESGVFFGSRDGDELNAVAGTHLVEREEGVGALGNVYTRRNCRGRGLAAHVTSAVVTELMRLGATTIALNVYQSNLPALHIYEKLGFRRHCEFVEGIIQRN